MLQQYYFCPNVNASSSCPITHPHVFSLRPPCFLHVPWHHTFNFRCTCAHHMYTMRNPYPLTSSPNPNSISRLYHMTSRSHAYLLYLFFHCRLIIITTIYTCPNPNPSPSLSTLLSYNTQNVRKNYVLVDSLLEFQKDLYNILFIQEPPWNFIWFASSTSSPGGQEVVSAPIYPEWTQVVRFPQNSEQTPRVMCFIHSRLSRLRLLSGET